MERGKQVDGVLTATTEKLEGYRILSVLGTVHGEVVEGIDRLYETAISEAQKQLLKKIWDHAVSMGANAVVGIRSSLAVMGSENGILVVAGFGTAVTVEPCRRESEVVAN